MSLSDHTALPPTSEERLLAENERLRDCLEAEYRAILVRGDGRQLASAFDESRASRIRSFLDERV